MIGKFVTISFLGAIAAAADYRGPLPDYYYDESKECSDLWMEKIDW